MGLLARLFGRDGGDRLPTPTYSNDAVIQRLEREEGVDRETARAWFGEMLVFLDLCARSDDVIAPPKQVDAAWHAFLLHSRDYEAYCRERFGRVIHHQPDDVPDPEADAYRRGYVQRANYGPEVGMAGLWLIPVGMEADGLSTEQLQEQIRDESEAGASGGGSYGGDSGGYYGGDSGSDGGAGGGASCGGGGSSCGGGGGS